MARPHGKPRKRVYRYKRPGKNLANLTKVRHESAACKQVRFIQGQPRTTKVARGFFLGGSDRAYTMGAFSGRHFAMRHSTLAACLPLLAALVAPAARADGLSDLKAALARLQAQTPLKATLDVKTIDKRGEG